MNGTVKETIKYLASRQSEGWPDSTSIHPKRTKEERAKAKKYAAEHAEDKPKRVFSVHVLNSRKRHE